MIRLQDKKTNITFLIVLIVLSISGFLIIFISTKNFGVGVSPDSVSYLAQAERILEGQSVSTTTWPPLYPAMLALVSHFLRKNLLVTAQILNSFLFGLLILTSGMIYRRHLKTNNLLLFLGVSTVIISTPLIPIFQMAWSEPIFILFSALFLSSIDKYFQNPNYKNLFYSSIWVSLGCLTRYIGVAHIIVGVVIIALKNKEKLKCIMTELLSFVFISSTPIILWLLRNKFFFGSFAGDRSSFINIDSYLKNIPKLGNSILSWYIPDRVETNRLLLVSIFFIIGFLVGIYYIKFRKRERRYFIWTYPFVIFIINYMFFLIATSPAYNQLIDSRYLSPILIPLNLLLIFSIIEISRVVELKFGHVDKNITITVLLIIFMTVPIIRTINQVSSHTKSGSGYTSRLWLESETLKYYKENISNCKVFSNGSDVILFSTGEIVKPMPSKSAVTGDFSSLNFEDTFLESRKSICIVWFDNISRDYFLAPDEILQSDISFYTIELGDGTIYYLDEDNFSY